MHVSITPEIVFRLGEMPITNTLITAAAVSLILIAIGHLAARRLKEVPKARSVQNIFEMIIEALLGVIDDVTGDRQLSYKFFPLVATIFIFILLSNWLGLLPGMGSIGFFEAAGENHHQTFSPLFRSAASDLNVTLALAIVSVLATQIFGIAILGFLKYSKKFIDFSSPIKLFVGLLEIISETAKMISFSFRLFGNIFAGEVLLVVIITLVPFIAPIPFFALEIFVGFIQALVFAMLTLVFLKTAVTAH